MTASIILSVVAGLAWLRRAIEPACPGCASKRWGESTAETLSCARCGWSELSSSSGATAPQYEMTLGQ